MFTSITDGLRSAWKHPKLLLLIWAWYGLLALIPTLPAWSWWNSVLGASPEAATVLKRFSFGVYGDLIRREGVSGLGLLVTVTAAVMIVAWVSSAFVFGGILEVLGSDGERRSFMHRFYRGGGHFFWRFIRLSLAAGVCIVLAVGVVLAVLVGASAPFADTEWEPAGYLLGMGHVLAVVIVAALFLLALDYARIRVARNDARGMLREYVGGSGFVLRNLLTTYGVAIPFIALLVVLMLCYVAYETKAPAAATWGAIGTLFLVQQAVVLGRVILRVALVGAERRVDTVKRPVPMPALAPETVFARAAGPVPEVTEVLPDEPGRAQAEAEVPPADRAQQG